MIKSCSTGKNYYFDEQTAIEALIEHLGRNHFSHGTGPINVYQCNICEGYHFTSKGERLAVLDDPKVKSRIEKLRQASDWEGRYR